MLIDVWNYVRKNPTKSWLIASTYVLLMIISTIQSELSTVSQPIISIIKWPFKWWNNIAPISDASNQANPFLEWVYILLTFIIISLFIYSLVKVLFGMTLVTPLICEDELAKLMKKIDKTPSQVSDDDIFNLLKEFERGYLRMFSISEKRNLICVWVKEHNHNGTNNWLGFNPNNINFDEYIEIIDTGIQNKKKHAHYSTDLSSYGTDAQEFAFYKNMGEFKFGVALLFMKSGNINEKYKQKFEVGSGLIQFLSQVDKITSSVV